MVKALVFDLGNVVLTNDFPYHTPGQLKEFCEYFNVTMDNLHIGFWSAFPAFSLGQSAENDFWEKFLYMSRAEKKDIKYAKEFYRNNQEENENMISLLSELKGRVRLASLTTIPREWLEFKRKTFKLDYYFEHIIASCDYGIEKPNPEIYKIIVDKMKINASEAVFIDDKESNLFPAKKLGMKTVLFRGQKDLEVKLARMLK